MVCFTGYNNQTKNQLINIVYVLKIFTQNKHTQSKIKD